VGRAIDNLGGDMLSWLIASSKIGGTVSAVGLAAGMQLNTSVAPFILRGVSLLGADSAIARCRCGRRSGTSSPSVAAGSRARPGAHDRLRRPADAFRSLPQRDGPRAHGRPDRADTHP
jgi:hypothetical protein